MDTRLLASPADLDLYHRWIDSHPRQTLWQSLDWKRYQEAAGREVRLYASFENGAIAGSALVVIDRTSLGLSTWDIPRGPVGRGEELLAAIVHDAKRDRCLSLAYSPVDPLLVLGSVLSDRHEQPEATRVIDLRPDDDRLLGQMKPKGRYNIGIAHKNGIVVRREESIDAYYELMRRTGMRDRFGIKPRSQYKAFLEHLPGAFLFLAYHGNDPVAGLLGCIHGSCGIYYYGASSYEHRSFMAPYLLQWEAMHYCKAKGCTEYDLLGIAPEGADEGHPWSGITSFKEKFGGTVVTYPPERKIVLKPVTDRLLKLKRRILG